MKKIFIFILLLCSYIGANANYTTTYNNPIGSDIGIGTNEKIIDLNYLDNLSGIEYCRIKGGSFNNFSTNYPNNSEGPYNSLFFYNGIWNSYNSLFRYLSITCEFIEISSSNTINNGIDKIGNGVDSKISEFMNGKIGEFIYFWLAILAIFYGYRIFKHFSQKNIALKDKLNNKGKIFYTGFDGKRISKKKWLKINRKNIKKKSYGYYG